MPEEEQFAKIIVTMTHLYSLYDEPFQAIKDGYKKVEMRLYDEKRQLLSTGDHIVFVNKTSGEFIEVVIKGLKRYKDFDELYAAYQDKTVIGYKPDEIADPKDMLRYYSEASIKKWGALAIEIEPVKQKADRSGQCL